MKSDIVISGLGGHGMKSNIVIFGLGDHGGSPLERNRISLYSGWAALRGRPWNGIEYRYKSNIDIFGAALRGRLWNEIEYPFSGAALRGRPNRSRISRISSGKEGGFVFVHVLLEFFVSALVFLLCGEGKKF